jgi:hypothetical protein
MQNQNKVGNFNTSLARNRFCASHVRLKSLCPVELQSFAGASPTHEFSSVLAFVIGCCYQIHTYVHVA